MDQADGQSVKLLNRTIVSSWMGDTMVSSWLGDQLAVRHMGHGSNFFGFFLYTKFTSNVSQILVQKFCVSMEKCSIGIEEVFSLTTKEQNVLELFRNKMFFQEQYILELFKNCF